MTCNVNTLPVVKLNVFISEQMPKCGVCINRKRNNESFNDLVRVCIWGRKTKRRKENVLVRSLVWKDAFDSSFYLVLCHPS